LAFDATPLTAGETAAVPYSPSADVLMRRALARATAGLDPAPNLAAAANWANQLVRHPERLAALAADSGGGLATLAASRPARADWSIKPDRDDKRFAGQGWDLPPYAYLAQAQLFAEKLWRTACDPLPGLAEPDRRRLELLGRLSLGALSPSNWPATNPDVLAAAARSGGRSLLEGAALWARDLARAAAGRPLSGEDALRVGKDLAATRGKVVYRNRLMELIQYDATTAKVRPEPVLLVPAWIMKFYILDLTPETSLVRHLVEDGFSVFAISWRNPGPEHRDLSLDDYRREGVATALDLVRSICGARAHAVGYCLGGTLLALEAARQGRDGEDGLASVSLLAAQTDFEDAGDYRKLLTAADVDALEALMSAQGVLEGWQMAASFYALRPNDMLWPRLVTRYLKGEAPAVDPLGAWLADTTRMPARMHVEYLRGCYLENRLARGGIDVDGAPASLKDIRAPLFVLGAELDHLAPWRSVQRIELYAPGERTFLLTGGGHNTSVVSPPGKPKAWYRMTTAEAGAPYVPPEAVEAAPRQDGSWWPAWTDWLADRSGPADRAAPAARAFGDLSGVEPAPGRYVRER
jgi:polyhydroxyalkanoate synthase